MTNNLNIVLFFLISLFVIVSCDEQITSPDTSDYVTKLLADISKDYPLTQNLDGAAEWFDDVIIESDKTVIFYDDDSAAEKSPIEEVLMNMGANLEGENEKRDVITVNLSAIPENKTSELNRQTILDFMQNVYGINSLPAVFIYGTYLGNDLTNQLEISREIPRPTLFNENSAYLELVAYAKERSVESFINNKTMSISEKPMIAYFNKDGNDGMISMIQQLIPNADGIDMKFYNLNDDIYGDVLNDNTPINLRKKQVYKYLVESGAGMSELGIFVYLGGEPMVFQDNSKKIIMDLAQSVVQELIKPQVDENGVTPVDEATPEEKLSPMSVLGAILNNPTFMDSIKTIVEEQLPEAPEDADDAEDADDVARGPVNRTKRST